MNLPESLAAAALLAALLPATAQAAAPWSDPVTVAGSSGQAGGAPDVLITRTRGEAIAFNAPGSFPGTALLRSVDGAAAGDWPGARDFDSTFGSFGAGDRLIYAGSDGHRRVIVATAAGPASAWTVSRRGPTTGGARVATAAAPKHTVAAFSTFGAGSIGSVYVVRQSGVRAAGATERISGRGHIRSLAVAVNARGDVLAAWDRSGTIESRLYTGRWRPVVKLGKVTAAMHIGAALGADRRALVSWVDQRVSEGNTGQNATVAAAARSAKLGFSRARVLEQFPDPTIPGGTVVQTAYTSDGRGIVTWSGRTAVRAALVGGRSFGAAQDIAPVAPDEGQNDRGLYALATGPDGSALVTATAGVDSERNQVLAVPFADGAFGPAETVSDAEPLLHQPSAAFDPASGNFVVAWQASQPNRVETSERPAP